LHADQPLAVGAKAKSGTVLGYGAAFSRVEQVGVVMIAIKGPELENIVISRLEILPDLDGAVRGNF